MKKLAMGVAQLLSGLFLLALPIIFICGLTWVSAIVSPWLIPAFFWTLVISIFILGPLAVIRKTRGGSAAGLMVASYVFGACLWMTSLNRESPRMSSAQSRSFGIWSANELGPSPPASLKAVDRAERFL